MFSLSVENNKGERLRLTGNPAYTVTEISGLYPPAANINTAINASFDGSTFKSSRLENRNIVITLAIEGSVEVNRLDLYQYIKSKQEIKIYFQNGSRSVWILGYVESFEIELFEEKQMAQISIICPSPYFQNAEDIREVFQSVVGLFEFPMDIPAEGVSFGMITADQEVNVQNEGDVSTGMIITFEATGAVTNPTLYNTGENKLIRILDTMANGDVIQINTIKGQKSVYKISGGVITNVLNKLDSVSEWLQLDTGDNIMQYTAAAGSQNLICTISYNYLYEGV